MFEVNIFTPAQFGAFVSAPLTCISISATSVELRDRWNRSLTSSQIPWLVINRGPLSALVHCNTDDESEEERNHTQRATWLGQAMPLDLTIFKTMKKG